MLVTHYKDFHVSVTRWGHILVLQEGQMQQKQTRNDKDPSGYWNTISIQDFDHSDLNEAMLTNQDVVAAAQRDTAGGY